MIAIDLSEQQPLDAYPKAIQWINFTANLDREGDTTIFQKQKKPFYIFHKELWKYCEFILL